MHTGAAKDLSLKHGPIGDLFECDATEEQRQKFGRIMSDFRERQIR